MEICTCKYGDVMCDCCDKQANLDEPTIKVSELREWCEVRRKLSLADLEDRDLFNNILEQEKLAEAFCIYGQVITKFCGEITDTGFCRTEGQPSEDESWGND